jgi:hypothetical protein
MGHFNTNLTRQMFHNQLVQTRKVTRQLNQTLRIKSAADLRLAIRLTEDADQMAKDNNQANLNKFLSN